MRQDLCKPEKASLICSLLRQSAGEFSQVVRDLSALVQDEQLVRQEAAHIGACHNKSNFTPIKMNRINFEFDHLRWITGKPQLHGVMLDEGELWRETLHKGLKEYVSCRFPVANRCMFKKSLGKRQMLVACIEAHQYHPSNHWNSFVCAYHFIYTRDIPNAVTGTKVDQYTGGINFLFYSAKDISGVTRVVR
uniref:F-actin-capping protein subunit alpha n=1 Tax=Amazona collaria TaxID=241587 RepID=A0A8B9GMV9_9PSIT